MNKYIISTGTVTHAIKGRDLLRKKGYKARIERGVSDKGCGYGIVLVGNTAGAEQILRNASVKILEIKEE